MSLLYANSTISPSILAAAAARLPSQQDIQCSRYIPKCGDPICPVEWVEWVKWAKRVEQVKWVEQE